MPGVGVTYNPYDVVPDPVGKPLYHFSMASASFIDMHGKPGSSSIRVENQDFDEDDVADWAESIAELANAALVAWEYSSCHEISPADAFAYDEGYSSVEARAVFLFQRKDRAEDVKRITVPAPDESWFSNGVIDLDNNNVQNAIDDSLVLLTDDYQFVRAYVYDGSDEVAATRIAGLDVQEPGIGDNPGAGPG